MSSNIPKPSFLISDSSHQLQLGLTRNQVPSDNAKTVQVNGVKYCLQIQPEHIDFFEKLIEELSKNSFDSLEDLQSALKKSNASFTCTEIPDSLTSAVIDAIGTSIILLNTKEDRPSTQRKKMVESGLLPRVIPLGTSLQPSTISKRMEDFKIPNASVAIFHHGKKDWAAGYGQITNANGAVTQCTEETRFQSASIGKPITAMVILKLAQEGYVDLDANVNDFLTSWQLPQRIDALPNEFVTLRMLLSHTAGINIGGFAGFIPGSNIPKSTVELLEGGNSANGIDLGPPVRVVKQPGLEVSYSGGGYLILQQLIEDIVSENHNEKKSFEQIINEIIFKPLEMTHSSYSPPSSDQSFAKGHKADASEIEGKYHLYPEQGPAGCWTTPTDLAQFALEIQNAQKGQGKILNQSSAQAMLTPQKIKGNLGEEITIDGGLGVCLKTDGGITSFMHGGHNEGFYAYLYAIGEDVCIITTNSENGYFLIDELLSSFANTYNWPQLKPTLIPTITMSPDDLKTYAGEYKLSETQSLKIIMRNDELFSDDPTIPFPARLYPIGPHQFIIPECNEEFTFIRANGDEIIGIQSNRIGDKSNDRPLFSKV